MSCTITLLDILILDSCKINHGPTIGVKINVEVIFIGIISFLYIKHRIVQVVPEIYSTVVLIYTRRIFFPI